MRASGKRLRDIYRKELTEQEEKKLKTTLRVFRDAMSTPGRDPLEIERLAQQLEARLRGTKR